MKALRVFEAFAGIGAQYSALKNLSGRPPHYKFKVVGISEWFINALLAYKNIHYPQQLLKNVQDTKIVNSSGGEMFVESTIINFVAAR